MEKRSLTRSLIFLNILNLALLNMLLLIGAGTGLTLLIISLSTGLILIFTLFVFSRQMKQISEVAKSISEGKTSNGFPDLAVEEFNELGKSINRALSRKDSTIGHLAAHREELRLLISSNEDPLWAMDAEGRVLWTNDSFRAMFPGGGENPTPYYWELIRDPFLMEYLRAFPSSDRKELREFVIDDHHYLLSAAADTNAKRRVFMLQSIDALRAAAQMKRDFVVNLAHELRTPLTAIKGFTEALEEDISNKDRYLKIIQNHTQRLIRLIADLEDLIQLERGLGLDVQQLPLTEFMANLSLILRPMVESAGLSLEIETASKDTICSMDPFKLEQVFINLAQNSIRHTHQGGIKIKAWTNSDKLLIDFSDSGEGIDPKNHSRIFERFWVGEKSRNRSKGGTGLGLAIVKHIVVLHAGHISVESEPGKGCKFHIVLPLILKTEHDWR